MKTELKTDATIERIVELQQFSKRLNELQKEALDLRKMISDTQLTESKDFLDEFRGRVDFFHFSLQEALGKDIFKNFVLPEMLNKEEAA